MVAWQQSQVEVVKQEGRETSVLMRMTRSTPPFELDPVSHRQGGAGGE